MNYVDDIRLEQFLQMKKEIRGSEQYLIVGIDAAKEKHKAFFGTAQGKTLVKILVIDNTIEGFERLDAYVERVKVQYSLSKVVSASSRQRITTSPWLSIWSSAGGWSFLLAVRR